MKIAFFSEIGSKSGSIFPRNYPNMRTDVSWAVALKAPVHSFDTVLFELPVDKWDYVYDLGIIIVPKKDPYKAIEFYDNNRRQCKQWAVMQEGNHSLYQDWPVSIQIEYWSFMSSMDVIYCHNEYDRKYYSGIMDCVPVRILPTLIIDDAMPADLCRPEDRTGVMIGGNWTQWYSGIDSYFIAQKFDGSIYAPSMGRKQPAEDLIETINYLPYMDWQSWMRELSKRKYAVHMMRTVAAGTFQLNCAKLGIPCISYDLYDTQRICFPELSIPVGDMVAARKCAKHLASNPLFYDHVSIYAKKMANDIYSEHQFVSSFYEPFN